MVATTGLESRTIGFCIDPKMKEMTVKIALSMESTCGKILSMNSGGSLKCLLLT